MKLAAERDIAAEVEALSARVEKARAAAEWRAQSIATDAPKIDTAPAAYPGRAPNRLRWSRYVIIALALLLVGAGAAMVSGLDDARDRPAPSPSPAPGRPVAADRTSPTVTSAPEGGTASQPLAQPAPRDAAPPTASPAAPPILPEVSPSLPATVVVSLGDSFWSLAEHRVSSTQGGVPTTAEVATYWMDLVEANEDRLVDPGNADLIYPGQTFVLP